MSLSMHEIAEKRQCKTCGFSDPEALEYNKQMDEAMNWAESKPWCRFGFRLEFSDDYLTCYKHPDYIEVINAESEVENNAKTD